MKKALVLAGGFPQIALIEELKSRDYVTVLADWNEEPVAKKYADIYYRASTLDVDAITEIARKEAVDFLISRGIRRAEAFLFCDEKNRF